MSHTTKVFAGTNVLLKQQERVYNPLPLCTIKRPINFPKCTVGYFRGVMGYYHDTREPAFGVELLSTPNEINIVRGDMIGIIRIPSGYVNFDSSEYVSGNLNLDNSETCR